MENFEEFNLTSETRKTLASLRFSKPTEIQAKTIPIILKGEDIIGNAATGSGKTLAFALGIIEKVSPGKGIQALVLTPTRELASQVAGVIRKLGKGKGLNVDEIYGGVDINSQIRKIKKSDVIVGNPGRILDHLRKKTLDFKKTKILVLDEADRMADMGFIADLKEILKHVPKDRQTMLFSATTSSDVEYIERQYMKSPKIISVNTYVDPSKLAQYYYDVPKHLKFSMLVHLLRKEESGIVMVFCNTRKNVDLISQNLGKYRVHSEAIHGGLDQKKRSRVIEQFKKNEVKILICTDVAARGLDIKGVTHVYNYDLPRKPEEYIHRIGRTARAGENGMAISILTNQDYLEE